MAKMKIKKGDLVQVISGRSQKNGGDRGKQGRVISVNLDTQRVLVEGINQMTRHTKAGTTGRGARTAAGGASLGMTRHLVDALDQHTLGVEIDRDDPALLAAVAAVLLRSTTDDLYEVTLLDFHLGHGLQHLRGERDDLHELLLAQLATDGPEDAGTARVAIGLEDDGGVLVKLYVRAVGTTTFLGRPNDDRLDDVTLLDGATGNGVLDGGDDNVNDAGVGTTGTTENTDAKNFLGTGVVGDTQSRLLLDHCVTPVVAPVLISEPCGTELWFGLLGAIENLHDAPVFGG